MSARGSWSLHSSGSSRITGSLRTFPCLRSLSLTLLRGIIENTKRRNKPESPGKFLIFFIPIPGGFCCFSTSKCCNAELLGTRTRAHTHTEIWIVILLPPDPGDRGLKPINPAQPGRATPGLPRQAGRRARRRGRRAGRRGSGGAAGRGAERSERSRGRDAGGRRAKCGQLGGAGEAQPGRPGKRLHEWASRMQMSRPRRANEGGGSSPQRDWLAPRGGGARGRHRPRHSCAGALHARGARSGCRPRGEVLRAAALLSAAGNTPDPQTVRKGVLSAAPAERSASRRPGEPEPGVRPRPTGRGQAWRPPAPSSPWGNAPAPSMRGRDVPASHGYLLARRRPALPCRGGPPRARSRRSRGDRSRAGRVRLGEGAGAQPVLGPLRCHRDAPNAVPPRRPVLVLVLWPQLHRSKVRTRNDCAH